MSKSSKQSKAAEDEKELETQQQVNIPEAEGKNTAEGDAVNTAPDTEIEKEKADDTENALVEKLQKELDELKDKHLRLSAEFDNYRKRTLKEKSDMLKYSAEVVLKDLLPVVDDLERALQAIKSTDEITAVKEGLTLIVSKFNEFLNSKGIKEIEAMGSELNTDLHEAVAKTPVQDDSQKGRVVDVIQKGYMLHDKVMRFSKVVVGE
jgi:molecular chaperone GrpE